MWISSSEQLFPPGLLHPGRAHDGHVLAARSCRRAAYRGGPPDLGVEARAVNAAVLGG